MPTLHLQNAGEPQWLLAFFQFQHVRELCDGRCFVCLRIGAIHNAAYHHSNELCGCVLMEHVGESRSLSLPHPKHMTPVRISFHYLLFYLLVAAHGIEKKNCVKFAFAKQFTTNESDKDIEKLSLALGDFVCNAKNDLKRCW